LNFTIIVLLKEDLTVSYCYFPLEGAYENYFIAIPKDGCVYGKLDSSKKAHHQMIEFP
jgi:hypothetical protein